MLLHNKTEVNLSETSNLNSDKFLPLGGALARISAGKKKKKKKWEHARKTLKLLCWSDLNFRPLSLLFRRIVVESIQKIKNKHQTFSFRKTLCLSRLVPCTPKSGAISRCYQQVSDGGASGIGLAMQINHWFTPFTVTDGEDVWAQVSFGLLTVIDDDTPVDPTLIQLEPVFTAIIIEGRLFIQAFSESGDTSFSSILA
ncbi:hypothetical protein AALO_G00002730 [Alosa alosa]|uniref:Uncharacterized protein n=1 Tax=Alosa alosa TaxID=278164 RepID=A0AAV6HH36_9TELE|nr:hypothetical protein AALO_G00002730 [Alosa alosa]